MLMSKTDFKVLEGIRKSLEESEEVKSLLSGAEFEKTLLAEYRGLKMKCKQDIIKPGVCTIDFKFVQSAAPEKVSTNLFLYGYHRQAAFYSLISEAHGIVPEGAPFYFIFVEKTPPYDYLIVKISKETMQEGRLQLDALIDKYKDTVLKNNFLGYNENKTLTI